MLIRLYQFFSVNITREGGIGIQITARAIAARLTEILVFLCLYLLGLLGFTARAGFLVHDEQNLVFLLKGFQIPFPLLFSFIIMIGVIGPVDWVSSQSILDVILVGSLPKAILRAMRLPFSFRNYCLLAQHAIALCDMIPWILFPMLFVDSQDTSICLLITQNLNRVVSVRINRFFLGDYKPLDMGHSPFPVIFDLHGGQKDTPLVTVYGKIVLMFILKFILHGCKYSVLSSGLNNIFFNFFATYFPIRLLKPSVLCQRWGGVLGQVVHLTDAISVLENDDSEGFHNVVVNIFDVTLIDYMMPLPHTLPQLKPNIFLKFNASVASQVHIPQAVDGIRFFPSPELRHGKIFFRSDFPLIPSYPLSQLFSLCQDHLVFIDICSTTDALSVCNPLINIHRGGGLQVLKHSECQASRSAYHSGSCMIKLVDKWKLPFYKVFLSCRKYFILRYKCFFSFSLLIIIIFFYFIETDSWFKPKVCIPRQRLAQSLGC